MPFNDYPSVLGCFGGNALACDPMLIWFGVIVLIIVVAALLLSLD